MTALRHRACAGGGAPWHRRWRGGLSSSVPCSASRSRHCRAARRRAPRVPASASGSGARTTRARRRRGRLPRGRRPRERACRVGVQIRGRRAATRHAWERRATASDLFEAAGVGGRAGGGEVHDDVGGAGLGALGGAERGHDPVVAEPRAGEVGAGEVGELGGDPQHPAVVVADVGGDLDEVPPWWRRRARWRARRRRGRPGRTGGPR